MAKKFTLYEDYLSKEQIVDIIERVDKEFDYVTDCFIYRRACDTMGWPVPNEVNSAIMEIRDALINERMRKVTMSIIKSEQQTEEFD